MSGTRVLLAKAIKEHQLFLWVLLLGFLTGIIYIQIIPAWQHYDEPTQFEYAWLIANRPGLPKSGAYDQAIRLEIAASMIENNFFRDLNSKPNLITDEPIWIGISQIGELPLYYWIVALPLRLTKALDVTFQLILVRLMSLLMFFVTILAAYGVAIEVTKANHPLRWLLPVSIIFLPSLVDIMTSVNDDVGAVAFFSLFIWSGIRIMRKGFNWLRAGVLILLAILCFWTKNTVVVAVFLVFIPLLFSLLRGSKRKYAWSGLAISSFIICLAAFDWGDAALWYRTSSPLISSSLMSSQAPLGARTIRIDVSSNEIPPKLIQVIPKNISKELRNHPISIGSWIWASKPATIRSPLIINGDQIVFDELQIDETPRFFLITSSLKQTNGPLIVALSPLENPIEEGFTTFYDGVVLTGGNHPDGEIPIFSDTSGEEGVWSGEQFHNAVRNSSGEFTWPYVRRWVDNLASRYFPGRPSLVLASILDISNFRPYYSTTLKFLFQSFWARFGWGNITISGYHPYFLLGIFSLVGMIGAALYLIRNFPKLDWGLLLFLGLPIGIIWGLTVSRGVYSYLGDHFIVPVARYAYPAIIPTMLLIDVGWLEVGKLGNDYLRIPRKIFYFLIICFFIALNIISIYSIIRFYQS